MNAFHNSRRRTARETFANCPHRWNGEYKQGVHTESDATRRGNVFHDARSRYITALFAAKESADLELSHQAWHQAITEAPLPQSEYVDTRCLWLDWVERYELNLTTFYSAEQGTFCKPFNCELRFDEMHVPSADVLRIVDAKTAWRMPTVDALRGSVQTGMYSAGARILYPGFQKYELVYDFVRMNTQITVCLSDAEMDGWVRWVQENDEAMDMAETTGQYPAKGGAHCSYCNVKCPLADNAYGHLARFVALTDAEEAIWRIAARQRANAIDIAALAGFADQHGPIVSGGQEWAHRPVVSRKYPADEVVAVLNQKGMTFPLWLNQTAVKPLITSKKKYAAIEDDIKRLAVEKVETKFSAKTLTTDDQKPEDE